MSSLSHIPAHIMTGFDTNRTRLINFMSLPPTLARIYPHLELCHTEHCHFECIVNGRNSLRYVCPSLPGSVLHAESIL